MLIRGCLFHVPCRFGHASTAGCASFDAMVHACETASYRDNLRLNYWAGVDVKTHAISSTLAKARRS